MAQVAIYCRLSNEDRNKQNEFDESESIQNQKSMLVGYCVEKGWDIYNIYCDEDYSGADSQRPDFLRMLEACEKNKVDIVLCKSQSRFSRDMEIIEKYLHNRFLEWGVRFISLVDHADTNDVGNKKARQINGLVNEWYLEELSDNIRKTLQNKRKNGEFTGSFAPYGYLKDPEDKNHLIIDDKTAPVVRNIFEWYVQGWGYRKITLRLNELGIPSPSEYKRQIHSAYKNINERTSHSQGLWTTPTIFKLLRNETYTGTLVQGKTRHVSYKNHSRKPVDQDEWIRTPNSHEAILDIDLWNQAQERLKSRSRSSKITLEPSLLSGKVKCVVCGAPMKRNVYYNTDRSIKYYNLKCGTYKIGVMNCENQSAISGLQLENAILEQLNELIYNYCDADKIQIKTQYEEDMRVIRQAISETKQRIEATEHKSLQLYEDKLDGTISVEQYHLFSQKFTESLESDKTKIECLEAQCNDIQSKLENDQHSADIISKYTHITKLTRPIVNEFINTIFVGTKKVGQPREITIKWNL